MLLTSAETHQESNATPCIAYICRPGFEGKSVLTRTSSTCLKKSPSSPLRSLQSASSTKYVAITLVTRPGSYAEANGYTIAQGRNDLGDRMDQEQRTRNTGVLRLRGDRRGRHEADHGREVCPTCHCGKLCRIREEVVSSDNVLTAADMSPKKPYTHTRRHHTTRSSSTRW
jgi:hypothetical protein